MIPFRPCEPCWIRESFRLLYRCGGRKESQGERQKTTVMELSVTKISAIIERAVYNAV